MEQLTFGQKAVGIRFNHAVGETFSKVDRSKQLFADAIDMIGDPSLDTERHSWFYNVLRTGAIQMIVRAQMEHVKFLTWED